MRVALERNAAGEHVGYIGTLSDFTEYREVQTRLVMSERMASLGTLAAGVWDTRSTIPSLTLMCNLELARRNVDVVFAGMAPGDERVARTSDSPTDRLRGQLPHSRHRARTRIFARAESEQIGCGGRPDLRGSRPEHRAESGPPPRPDREELCPVPQVRADETRLGQVFLEPDRERRAGIPEGHADDERRDRVHGTRSLARGRGRSRTPARASRPKC